MIKIFDNQLNYLGLLDTFNSFQCTSRYADSGEFAIKTILDDKTNKLLKVGNFIQYEDFAGIIDSVNKTEEYDSAPLLKIGGLDLTSLLNTRVIWNNLYYKGKSEDFLRKIVNDNAINPSNKNRKIPFLELGEYNKLPQITERNTENETLLKECQKVCNIADYGFELTLDARNKKMFFNVYQGIDKTAGNPNQVIIGKEYDNVLFQDYLLSKRDEITTCLTSTDSLSSPLSVGNEAKGFDRKEVFVKGSIQKTAEQTQAEYENALLSEAKNKLKSTTECFDVDLQNVTLNKGDFITIKDKKWNIQFNTRVIEKQITIEKGMKTTSFLLGEDIDIKVKERT